LCAFQPFKDAFAEVCAQGIHRWACKRNDRNGPTRIIFRRHYQIFAFEPPVLLRRRLEIVCDIMFVEFKARNLGPVYFVGAIGQS